MHGQKPQLLFLLLANGALFVIEIERDYPFFGLYEFIYRLCFYSVFLL